MVPVARQLDRLALENRRLLERAITAQEIAQHCIDQSSRRRTSRTRGSPHGAIDDGMRRSARVNELIERHPEQRLDGNILRHAVRKSPC